MTRGESSEPAKHQVTVERRSERELVVTRAVSGAPRIVFEAWTDDALFRQWWAPRSFCVTILSCERDVSTGGTYRLLMGHPSLEQPMAFFGRYLDVTPHARLVWSNEEGADGGAVTTVTFEDRAEETLIVIHELFPSKDALDDAIASGSTSGWGEQFEQLDELLVAQAALGHRRQEI